MKIKYIPFVTILFVDVTYQNMKGEKYPLPILNLVFDRGRSSGNIHPSLDHFV